MISIGLIERIPRRQDGNTIITYFFCQNADYELNTVEPIIKGLILRLVNQQEQLITILRRRWDTTHKRFDKDITSWRMLWHILLEMLESCWCRRVYVIIDALDECQDNSIADLFKLIVRTGLYQPSKIKWLLTSRPLDSAERELLAGADQVLVSLELNSEHIAKAVKTYIACKTDELDRRQSYGSKNCGRKWKLNSLTVPRIHIYGSAWHARGWKVFIKTRRWKRSRSCRQGYLLSIGGSSISYVVASLR